MVEDNTQLPSTNINYLQVTPIAVCFRCQSMSIPRPTADDDRYSNSCKQCAYLSRKTTRVPRPATARVPGKKRVWQKGNLPWEAPIVGLGVMFATLETTAGYSQWEVHHVTSSLAAIGLWSHETQEGNHVQSLTVLHVLSVQVTILVGWIT